MPPQFWLQCGALQTQKIQTIEHNPESHGILAKLKDRKLEEERQELHNSFEQLHNEFKHQSILNKVEEIEIISGKSEITLVIAKLFSDMNNQIACHSIKLAFFERSYKNNLLEQRKKQHLKQQTLYKYTNTPFPFETKNVQHLKKAQKITQ